jgi:hypothetical protein
VSAINFTVQNAAIGLGSVVGAVVTHVHRPVWDPPGRGVLAGRFEGPDAIVGFLARSFELSGGTLNLQILDVLASDTGAAHVQRVTADHEGRRLDCVEILHHKIVDGHIVRTQHRPDPYADAFFG